MDVHHAICEVIRHGGEFEKARHRDQIGPHLSARGEHGVTVRRIADEFACLTTHARMPAAAAIFNPPACALARRAQGQLGAGSFLVAIF